MNDLAVSYISAIGLLLGCAGLIWLWKRGSKLKNLAKESDSKALSGWLYFVHYGNRFVTVIGIGFTFIFGVLWLFLAILQTVE